MERGKINISVKQGFIKEIEMKKKNQHVQIDMWGEGGGGGGLANVHEITTLFTLGLIQKINGYFLLPVSL